MLHNKYWSPESTRKCAEEEGNRAIGVILSGSSGSDGIQGLCAVKTAGGMTFAQDEKSAKYSRMPAAAIASGSVDFVFPPRGIAQELTRLAEHPYATVPESQPVETHPSKEKHFEEILSIIRRLSGVDFSQYKRGTLDRRVHRRMALQKLDSLKDYAAFLKSHQSEARELFTDVLIHVTGFFRDAAVYHTLKRKIFPRIVKDRHPDDSIRIWVTGCSTGEEVYSIAISLAEFLSEKDLNFPVQIFGTDINDPALDKARSGYYPEGIKSDVSAERLRRFFVKADGGYRINKAIREMCVFARQNLATDPPFSNLDLLSCRNVLIYFGADLQRKVLPIFHYALKPKGFLMLGTSESIGAQADLFSLVENKAKIYQKKASLVRPAVAFTPPPELPAAGLHAEASTEASGLTGTANLGDIERLADRLVLTQYSHPGAVINRNLEVLQFRGKTGQYLEHGHGKASLDLIKMAREGLGATLRSVIARAIRQNIRVREEGAFVRQNGDSHRIDIEVVPFQVGGAKERFYLVLFEPPLKPQGKGGTVPARGKAGRHAREDSSEVTRLREELASTRESLQAVIEEQEATNEELRSANEEIMSSNEELQSTNEELETAKEELQSTNEELATLNDELESRNSELEQANNDVYNLLSSINIPVVMVDEDIRIRRFTLAAEKLLNCIPGDVGRPLTDINLKIRVPELDRILRNVINNLEVIEQEVQDSEGRWWSLRLRPYKTIDNRIGGAIVVLFDIDLLKSAMVETEQRMDFAEAIVNTVREPLVVLTKGFTVQSVNEAFFGVFRTRREETIGRSLYDLGNGHWDTPKLRTLLEEILVKNTSFKDFEIEREFPKIGRKKMLLNARRLHLGSGDASLILLAIEEVEGGDNGRK